MASIVVPVHGHWQLTEACLRAIGQDRTGVPYEVVVVDDASPDATAAHLLEAEGLEVLTLPTNHGFLAAVNAGLRRARGTFVVLLNNDTEVQAGWLDALVSAASDPDVGVVGAKLVYPDGRLQEAGGIIWRDGSGYNFGRNGSAVSDAVSFVRDVDFCSGACLLVRRSLLEELGGLDPRFAPAYYEDTDLCFAARQHGYRVLYQPLATVCHHEGASHGTDLSSGVKQHQMVNQVKFRDKWGRVLEHHPTPDWHPRRASWRRPAGRALVVDTAAPPLDGPKDDQLAILLSSLDQLGFAVSFFPGDGERHPGDGGSPTGHLRQQGIEVIAGRSELVDWLGATAPDLRLVIFRDPELAWQHYLLVRSAAPAARVVYVERSVRFTEPALLEPEPAPEPEAPAPSGQHHPGAVDPLACAVARLCDRMWVVSEHRRSAVLAAAPEARASAVTCPGNPPPQPAETLGALLAELRLAGGGTDRIGQTDV